MNSHVHNICSNAFYYLYKIRIIRKSLSRRSTETLIHGFVSSRVDHGLQVYQLNKLQTVQNAAARLIFQESKYTVMIFLTWAATKPSEIQDSWLGDRSFAVATLQL